MEAVPVIDISSLVGNSSEQEKYKTSMEVGQALCDLGFLYVTNHGVEQTLRDKIMQNTQAFFAMPLEKKMEVGQAADSVRGYVQFGKEKTKRKADWKEGMYLLTEIDFPPAEGPVNLFRGKNPWPNPEYVPGFKEDIELYLQQINVLGQTMMSAIAMSLGMDKDFFTQRFLTRPFTDLALLHYPPYERSLNNNNNNSDVHWGLGEHTDYGCLTFLTQCDTGGLEVKTTDGRWVEAPPRDDAFVVNACDMLEAWTNGACRSSPHRVRLPTKHRHSVVAFYGPDFDSMISPLKLDKNIGDANFTYKFNFPVHYGSYIGEKWAKSFPMQKYITYKN